MTHSNDLISDKPNPDFSVVGIGASAGGLEALEGFFSHCPVDTGAAFVVIQHLSPDHKSMMLDLLSRYTTMQVIMVEGGMKIEPDKVYLIPAGMIMRLHDNVFDLTPKAPNTLTLPIDIFFNSLAQYFGRRAVGIVLSGTGSDGSRGALAINAAGGFLMAQELKTAKFDGMPGSVIGTGLVDAILPSDKLPERLLKHIKNTPTEPFIKVPNTEALLVTDDQAYEGILQLLLNSGGIDFQEYKVATILRRIERRMQVRHLSAIGDYYKLLQDDIGEIATLRRELLIPVTNFFRDPEAFALLQSKVVERIVENIDVNASIRVWVAGTSTGEEAYSIAILFIEAFEKTRRWPNLKIFATDVSQESIDVGSSGIYPESAAAELTNERLERFFSRSGANFQVKPELRQMIVFARHNLLSDPPFTQMDLVSCRNTLIYFMPEAQKKAIRRLQFAIKPEGCLFLGSSESISSGELGFQPLDSKHKLFQRSLYSKNTPFDISTGASPVISTRKVSSRVKRGPHAQSNDTLSIDSAINTLVTEYAAPSMLVNSHNNEVVHLFGKVQPFFRAREGTASLDINKLLPENMIPVASALMFKAAKEHERMVSDLIHVDISGEQNLVRLSVRPLDVEQEETLLLLSFEVVGQSQPQENLQTIDVNAETAERIEVLETELAATRESLQATIEELETSNEELQATNEELMASNEELQSSNEELQSVNEELNTVNAEYQEKVGILNRVNADLDSMAKAVGVATVFVDHELNLTRFSPDAVGLFKLRSSDVGRPLDEIANTLRYPNLMEDLKLTLDTERMVQKEVDCENGDLFMVRILPYRVSSNRRGAVASFIDVTVFRDQQRLQVILNALPEHIAVLQPDGVIALTNTAWERFARANGDPSLEKSGVGKNYLEVCSTAMGDNPDPDAKRAYHGIKAVLEGSSSTFSMQYPCHSPTEKRWFVLNAAPIQGFEFGAVISHINISAWYQEQPTS